MEGIYWVFESIKVIDCLDVNVWLCLVLSGVVNDFALIDSLVALNDVSGYDCLIDVVWFCGALPDVGGS